jgi:uncharacterized membrane protein YczE
MVEAKLGVGSWAVLQQGVSRHSPLSFGVATVVVSIFVLGIAFILGAQIGIGSLADAFLLGVFIDLLMRVRWVQHLATLTLVDRATLLVVGLLTFSLGSALYISAAFGGGPRDALMLGIWQRTGLPIAACRAVLELSVLTVGFALGGTVGIGTLAMAFLVGPCLHASFDLLQRVGVTASASGHVPSPAVRALG